MKTPRVNDFDPNAKVPQLGSPMENMPVIKPPAKNPDTPTTRKEDIRKSRYRESQISGKPDIPIARKPDIPKSGNQTAIKVPKYYTQLPQALQDEIKVYAIRHRRNDYEVVIQAIEDFFKKQK